jgi:hypothetical protein
VAWRRASYPCEPLEALGSAALLKMSHRSRLLKIILGALGLTLLVVAISAVTFYADIRRIGCESGGQLLGPGSNDGYSISNASRSGACFVSLVALEQRHMRISRVICSNNATLASCQSLRWRLAPAWSNFFGSRCTSVSFIGDADCTCVQTGQGCQKGDWPVEMTP